MRAVVVYESMYGNTHEIATQVADGLRAVAEDVTVVPVGEATPELVTAAGLLVVGGPTHVHGMTRPSTRKAAIDAAEKPGSGLDVDRSASGPGLRDWFEGLGQLGAAGAAFDTRISAPAVLTGQASKGIGRQLRRHGLVLVVEPESFLVTKDSHLEDGEAARARRWGEDVGRTFETLVSRPGGRRSNR